MLVSWIEGAYRSSASVEDSVRRICTEMNSVNCEL